MTCRLAILFSSSIVLASCAAGNSGPVALKSAFDPASVAWLSGPGKNTLEGTAVLRTVGGDPKTCAALPVQLIPVSAYAEERMTYLYGSTSHGYNPVLLGRRSNFANENEEYKRLTKQTICDAQGNFEFGGLPDGSYFVIANVVWGTGAGGLTEGGAIMERAELHGGETKRLILTQ